MRANTFESDFGFVTFGSTLRTRTCPPELLPYLAVSNTQSRASSAPVDVRKRYTAALMAAMPAVDSETGGRVPEFSLGGRRAQAEEQSRRTPLASCIYHLVLVEEEKPTWDQVLELPLVPQEDVAGCYGQILSAHRAGGHGHSIAHCSSSVPQRRLLSRTTFQQRMMRPTFA
ncbi:hypothetical protein RQP46_007403 [Phenoliferia psychrophenolica]